LLDEHKLRNEGYLNPLPIRRFWQEHISGKRRWEFHLWDVLMFQSWLEYQRRNLEPNELTAPVPIGESA
jgi:asparagine synthase (glutamine-hydrolysing)